VSARILVVDDEPDLEALVLQKFRRQVRDGAVTFLFARDGVDALTVLEGNRDIDMLVCDINMPRMDGLTLLQKLQETERQLSTIIVSAYGDMANIRTAMNRGAFDFLMKPIDFADLEATIAKTLRHFGELREAQRRQAAAERAHAALSRHFSPNLAERLASDGGGVELVGQRRDVAALFTDIAGFTTLVETIKPDVLSEWLNDYLKHMTEIVFAHDGTVVKVGGDALYVLFGAPGDQPDHAARAVACALELDRFAQAFREAWRARNVALGVTRIGLNAGPAIVGNFGGDRIFNYTAYGDTINTAARLEAANKQLGTRVLISDSVVRQLAEFRGRPVGDLLLRGRSEPLRVYEPLPPETADEASLEPYLQAFARLEAGDPAALGAFAAEVGKHPDDQLASFHLKRLLNGQSGTRIQME
jgi:adenylate cyclase